MKTKKILVIALGLVVLTSLAACAPRDTGLNNNLDRMSTQTRINQNTNWDNLNCNGMDNMMNDFNTNTTNLNNGMMRNNMTTSMGNLNTKASTLARKIGALPEVDKASVVLTNYTALVGVDLKGSNTNNTNLSTNLSNTSNNGNISSALRTKIVKMVNDEVNVKDVSITADPNLTTRIRNISSGMTNQVGNDMNSFTNDIEQLIRDIVPGGTGTRRTNMMNR